MYRLKLGASALSGLVALSGLAASAQAESPQLRVTALAGLERTDSAPGSGAKDGLYYGVQLGADWKLGPVLAGVEAEIGDSSAQDRALAGQPRHGVFGNAAIRLAVPVTDRARLFARGGFAYHRIDVSTGSDFAGSGYVIGGGGEFDLTPALLLRGEYRYSDYGQAVRGQHFVGGVGLRF